jgi:hypothetical protein
MPLCLFIGGEDLHITASPQILDAIAERYGPFLSLASRGTSGHAPINLDIRSRSGRFLPAYGRPIEAHARESALNEIAIEGEMCGRYSITSRQGSIENASGLGEVDALLRIVLSTTLPLDGALLMHGAALRMDHDLGIALCGASGSGKSTAAAALGAFCDEFVVLRPTRTGIEVESTPYWIARPYRSRCAVVVCLARGTEPGFASLRGSEAVRILARHVIRYVGLESVERAVFDLLCSIGASFDVKLASCPDGDAFIPFLREKLWIEEVA